MLFAAQSVFSFVGLLCGYRGLRVPPVVALLLEQLGHTIFCFSPG